MASVLDIGSCPLLPLQAALDAPGGAARALLFAGGQPATPRPMLWPAPDPQIETPHLEVGLAPDVELHAVADAVVGGPGAHVRRGGSYLHAESAWPGYVRHWMEREIAAEYWAFGPVQPARRLALAWSLIHFNLVYGHWLTEMFPKLFTIAHLAELGVRAPIVLPSSAPAYVRATVEEVLPGQEIVTYDPHAGEQLAVERLLLPGMMQRDYIFHPELGRRLDAYVAERTPPEGGSALFVSRTALRDQSAFRRLENTAAVEAEAARLGLEIVHPETLPWREQVSLFGGARLIVGEFGSGLHNALFAPAGARVVALNWIVPVQSLIANFRGQDVGYLLDPDGQPRTFSLEPGMRGFRIDPLEFRRRLAPLVDPPRPRETRRPRLFGLKA